jgi:large subunit ribosomal protein L17
MRHGKKDNHLGRKVGHRRALLKNLAQALIEHKRITTTLAKAKALRGYIEPLVTKAKTNTTHSRRVVFSYLQNKEAVKELFSTVAEKIGDRPGGYVRVLRTGYRHGDGAEMAMIEFVDFNEVYKAASTKEESKSSRRRRRRGGSGGGTKPENATTRATAPVSTVMAADTNVEDDEALVEDAVIETEAITEETSPEITDEATPRAEERKEEA